MKKAYADLSENKDIIIRDYKKTEIGNDFFSVVCQLNIENIKEKRSVQIKGEEITLLDKGYKALTLYPEEENFTVRTFFNNQLELTCTCFDIATKVDYKAKIPFSENVMLRIITTENNEIIFINEDQLDEDFRKNKINIKDYNLIKRTADKIVNKYHNAEQYENIKQIALKYIEQ